MKKKNIGLLMMILALVSCGSTSEGGSSMDLMPFVGINEYIEQFTYRNTTNLLPALGKVGVTRIGDPHVFYDESNDKYYMTGTGGPNGANEINVWESVDLTTWSEPTQVFNSANVSWGEFGAGKGLWGAEIHKRGNTYYLYYSSWKIGAGSPRIGVATATTIYGPYIDKGTPFFDYGYSVIDTNLFTDSDGTSYFYYVKDATDNIIGGVHTSQIYVVEVNSDFISVHPETEATLLLGPDQPWERVSGGDTWKWTEAPWMLKHEDTYYLFYSANRYDEVSYAIGYATSASPNGPFVKYEGNPWLKTVAAEFSGPGNNSFFYSKDGKELFTAYHMHTNPDSPSGNRFLNIDRVGFHSDGSVFISGPTNSYQPIPSGTKANHTLLSQEATITTSALLEGYNQNAINDGFITLLDNQATEQFVSSDSIDDAFVTLTFDEVVYVHSIYVYNPITIDHRSGRIDIEFSDGSRIEDVTMSLNRGEPAIIHINGYATTSIKIVSAQSGFGQTNFGLNEVMVFGRTEA